MACQRLMLFVTVMVARTLAQTIEYECFPDGTVRIKNPGKSMYTAVFANNSANICQVNWEDESTKEHSIITNCEMNLPIMVTLMNRPSSNDFILGGTENIHFLIRCSEIPHAGVNKLAVDLIPIRLSTTSIHITPFFTVVSRMYQNSSKSVVVKSALVGVPLYWVIQGPEEYHLMPLRCDAFPGRTSDNVTKHKNVIVDGCTEDSSLVGNFTLVKTGEVATEFRTFRFYNSPFVTIQCIVRVCPQGSVSCDFLAEWYHHDYLRVCFRDLAFFDSHRKSCSGRRKRSSAMVSESKTHDRVEMVFTHLTVHDMNENISESSSADKIVAMANSIMLSVIVRCL